MVSTAKRNNKHEAQREAVHIKHQMDPAFSGDEENTEIAFGPIVRPDTDPSRAYPTQDSPPTVQITFIFIGQTHLVFGKRVCTCVTKHSNAFRTFLNWLKNSKRVWDERKLHILSLPIFANFDL